MKVKELIEALKQHDPELIVTRSGYEGGVEEITSAEVGPIALNVNTAWYYGKHEQILYENEKYPGHEIVQAVYIS
jgi:preprotein translocase subunit YajC